MQDNAASATPASEVKPAEPGDLPPEHAPPTDLEGVLDEISAVALARGDGEVSVGDVMAGIGERSFGPLLLVPSLIGLSPIGAIPFLPAVMVAIEIFVIVQMLLGWQHFWIPPGLARRAVPARRLARAMDAMRPGARFVDGFIAPRLSLLTEGVFFYLIAVACLAVALVTPIIELIPVAGIVPNAAVVAFSLAITARDGVWALLAFAFTASCVWLISAAF